MTSVALMKVAATFFLGGFFSLVTIINPPSALPLFTVLSGGLNEDGQRALARRACMYSFMILVVSLFAGGLIMNLFGVSSAALRVAGGICVLLLGHGMLFGRGGIDAGAHDTHANPAFFPLAEVGAYAGTLAAMLATCVLTWLVLRGARVISQRLGANGIEVLTRLMGFLLLCIGVQFIASGVRSFVGGS